MGFFVIHKKEEKSFAILMLIQSSPQLMRRDMHYLNEGTYSMDASDVHDTNLIFPVTVIFMKMNSTAEIADAVLARLTWCSITSQQKWNPSRIDSSAKLEAIKGRNIPTYESQLSSTPQYITLIDYYILWHRHHIPNKHKLN